MSDIVVPDIGEADTPVTPAADSTALKIVNDTLRHLYTGTRVEADKLADGVVANDATLTTMYQVPAIKSGAKLSIDLEDYRVWDATGATVTVEPGEFGSTAAAHDAGAIIHVNAEFTHFDVFSAINDELRSLSAPGAGLYREQTVPLVYNPARLGYDLTDVTNVDGILTVIAETIGPEQNRVPVNWRLERNVDTDIFPSGKAIFLYQGWSGRDIFVTYKAQFGVLETLADNVFATTGMPASAHDILAMGAALRLAGVAEIDRNQMSSQGGSRRANEVPAGSRVNAPRWLAAKYRERLVQESDRLKRAYPVRLKRW